MSYYRYEYQRDTYSYPRLNHGYGGGGYGGGRPLRDYEEPRRRGYMSYSNRSGLGGMGNPFCESISQSPPSMNFDLR